VGDKGYCPSCGRCFEVTDGTLALTRKYGQDIPDLTQNLVEADLAQRRDYESNCRGKLEDCKEKLTWGVERYAKFPPLPELLELKKVPRLLNLAGGYGLVFGLIIVILLLVIGPGIRYHYYMFAFNSAALLGVRAERMLHFYNYLLMFTCWIPFFVPGLFVHFKAKAANGNRPAENYRRQEEYEKAKVAAMRDAEREKEREDYRLKEDIRKLNGLIKSVQEKAENIRRDYAERVRRSQTNRY